MQIGQAIFEALMHRQEALYGVVADWIEDNRSRHPEAAVYLKRLRSPGLRIRTIIDVVCKFGSRNERKLYSRINRIILKMRHRPESTLPDIKDVFSMEDRRLINCFLRVAPEIRSRKRPVLAMTRKRTVSDDHLWYMKALQSLLAKHYLA